MIGDDTDLLVLSMFYTNKIQCNQKLFKMRPSSDTIVDIEKVELWQENQVML